MEKSMPVMADGDADTSLDAMVQDSITDHIDTARENWSHLNFTYRMAIIFAEIAPWYVTYPRF